MFSLFSVQKMFIFDFYCFRSHLYQTYWENCHKSMHIRWKIQQNLNICTLFQVPQKPLWTWKKILQRHFSKNILKMWHFDECCVTKWGGCRWGHAGPPTIVESSRMMDYNAPLNSSTFGKAQQELELSFGLSNFLMVLHDYLLKDWPISDKRKQK